MQGIFQKENTDKALKYGIYRHLPTYEKIIRNLVSFYDRKIQKPTRDSTGWFSLLIVNAFVQLTGTDKTGSAVHIRSGNSPVSVKVQQPLIRALAPVNGGCVLL